MNKLYYLLILFFSCKICDAQNFIPNGDFEQFIGCPSNIDQYDSVLFWVNPSANQVNGGSPDYFNQCGAASASVPNNFFGFQQAHSGVAYSGIILFASGLNMREYIEVPLTSALVANTCYHFEMFVSLAHNHKYTTDAIGAYFSDTIITGVNNFNPLPFIGQINNMSGNLFDTLNWTLVSGNYTAVGGESYLIIGNFKDDTSTFIQLFNNAATYSGSYVYIDDVSLIEIPPCNTGINTLNEYTSINLSPNPFSDKLKIINSNNELLEIILYDMASRKLLQQKFTNSVSINTGQLAKGIYIYEVRNKKGIIKKGKVVKE